MKKIKVNIDSVSKVKEFVNILNSLDGDYDLVSERYTVDAKSIMGIFSLNISDDLELVIHDNAPADKAVAALEKFTV